MRKTTTVAQFARVAVNFVVLEGVNLMHAQDFMTMTSCS